MNNKEIAETLILNNVRPTQQRIAVYRFLKMNPIHPSADTIYNALSQQYPALSKTTIYNSLKSLLEAGLIRCVTIRSDEQRFDANVADHGHFYCKHCDRVYDFDVEQEQVRALSPEGYQCMQGDVYFIGFCPECLRKRKDGGNDGNDME